MNRTIASFFRPTKQVNMDLFFLFFIFLTDFKKSCRYFENIINKTAETMYCFISRVNDLTSMHSMLWLSQHVSCSCCACCSCQGWQRSILNILGILSSMTPHFLLDPHSVFPCSWLTCSQERGKFPHRMTSFLESLGQPSFLILPSMGSVCP